MTKPINSALMKNCSASNSAPRIFRQRLQTDLAAETSPEWRHLQNHQILLLSPEGFGGGFYKGLGGHAYSTQSSSLMISYPSYTLIQRLSYYYSLFLNISRLTTTRFLYVYHVHSRKSKSHLLVVIFFSLPGCFIFFFLCFIISYAYARLARRISRDTVERGRDIQSVFEQYAKFVNPAFDNFILPSKKFADVIIPRGGENHVAIDLIVQHIRTKPGQQDLCKIYPNVNVIHSIFQRRGMHTLIRDREISKHDFVFYSDRLMRLVVEHGLGYLPFIEKKVDQYILELNFQFCKKLCGVSIIGSMENALRACCKGIKIGKILIHRDGDIGKQLIYEKLPKDISERHVLLLDPVLATGNSANQAIELLIKKGVPESSIIFLDLISAPEGIHCLCNRFPSLKIVTSEVDAKLNEEFRVIPGLGEFGDRCFGTDDYFLPIE
ncbi:hypothetical protein PVL29_021935 [Vitis rotundifolia]|uniref:uracil phosphoribosyltransferase n=1 Tax=Vitis rotundifolia TaxID=103349 RepID=A0AA39DAH0_VITRO|nr:hypothetical protein PVL29_021935 [Vitis rotundifolia]